MSVPAAAIRRLPVVPAPADDETLPSYMQRLAAQYRVPLIELLRSCGLAPADSATWSPSGYGVHMTPDELADMHAATGIPVSRLRQMLVMNLHGVAADLSAVAVRKGPALRAAARHTWLFFNGSFACVECLRARAGAWRLRWRVPWSYACVEHSTLMLDVCPACSQPMFGSRERGGIPAFRGQVPRPGHCTASVPGGTARGRAARACGHPLWDADPVRLEAGGAGGRVLAAQRRIDQVLDSGVGRTFGEEADAVSYLHQARVLASLLLRFATVGGEGPLGPLPAEVSMSFEAFAWVRDAELAQAAERPASARRGHRRFHTAVPRQAALMASVAPTATELLACASPEELTEELAPLARAVHARMGAMGRATLRQRLGVSETVALALVGATAREHPPSIRRRRSARPGEPQHVWGTRAGLWAVRQGLWGDAEVAARFEPRHVPQLLWEEVFEQEFAELLATTHTHRARAFLSLLVVQRSWRATWKGAGELLQVGGGDVTSLANSYTTRTHRLGCQHEVRERTDALIGRLNRSPMLVDYRQRSQRWPEPLDIETGTWRELCRDAGLSSARGDKRRRLAAVYVWALLTGGDPGHAVQAASQRGGVGADYTYFASRILPSLRPALNGHAEQLAAPEPLIPVL